MLRYGFIKKQSAFTVVELTIVILLVVLAVTAVPGWLNMQSEARKSALLELIHSMKYSAFFIHNKAQLQGVHKDRAASFIDGNSRTGVKIVYGFPTAGRTGIVRAVPELAGSGSEWHFDVDTNYKNGWALYITQTLPYTAKVNVPNIIATGCYVVYQMPDTQLAYDKKSNKLVIEVGDNSGC